MKLVAAVIDWFGVASEYALGDREADRVVPPTGHTVWLTVLASAAMAFLAVFALALALASAQLAHRWADGLAQTLTIRVPSTAPEGTSDRILTILAGTPGLGTATEISTEDRGALLEPWLGPDLPLDGLPLPVLIDVQAEDGLDIEGLRLRLAAEVPSAVLDDHSRWRAPLVRAASRLRSLGWFALALIAGVTAATITLGAQSALASNAEVIRVLRLIGARDSFVSRAFVRRFTLRALTGAAVGAVLGGLALAFLPQADDPSGLLTGLGFSGASWLLIALIPPLAALTAFFATRRAAARALRRIE